MGDEAMPIEKSGFRDLKIDSLPQAQETPP
jgi:hypothetical protein